MNDSSLWSVKAVRLGNLQAFNSEYEMEMFLLSHPQVIGFWDEDAPPLIWQQIFLKGNEEKKHGRIDLVGIQMDDQKYTLKIFELKRGEITEESVKQLVNYLETWKGHEDAQKKLKSAIEKENQDIPNLENILKEPKGVLVGSRFDAQAMTLAEQKGIAGLRLIRFVSENSAEEYVILEDQVEDLVSRSHWSWEDIGIKDTDEITLELEGKKISARPARPDKPDLIRWRHYITLLQPEVAKDLVEKKETLLAQVGYAREETMETLVSLESKPETPITLLRATHLLTLAFDPAKTKIHKNPTWYWKSKEETLAEIIKRKRS